MDNEFDLNITKKQKGCFMYVAKDIAIIREKNKLFFNLSLTLTDQNKQKIYKEKLQATHLDIDTYTLLFKLPFHLRNPTKSKLPSKQHTFGRSCKVR